MATVIRSGAAPTGGAERYSLGYRRYVLGLLLIINFLAFLDRQIINILAESIKRELHLSDTQLGLLTGLSFAILYTFLGLPIARLADRSNRVRVIGVSLVVWSGFTALCGFAQNYVQLLLARVGVGVGEAGCSPSSHSLLSDYFPREQRASALGFYSMGVPLGVMAGLAFGGLIADAYGWRVALMVAGSPGLFVAVVAMLTMREPRQHLAAEQKRISGAAPGLGQALRELATKPAFWWAASAAAADAFLAYGHNAFYGSFFLRNHAAGIAALSTDITGGALKASGFLGISLGLMLGTGGILGSFFGGRICDHFAKRDVRLSALIPAGAILLAVPLALTSLFIPYTPVALLLLGPTLVLKTTWYGPVFALVQNVVQSRTRATAAAILLGMMSLVGLGLGPMTVGFLSDSFAHTLGQAEGLRWALAATALTGIVPPACLWMASRTLAADIVEDATSAVEGNAANG